MVETSLLWAILVRDIRSCLKSQTQSLDYALGVSRLPVLLVAEPGFEPTYAHPGDAGADLRSRVAVIVPAGGRATVPTGVRIALPAGYVGLVHPRSGLAAKHGITVLNAPGTWPAERRTMVIRTSKGCKRRMSSRAMPPAPIMVTFFR